MSFFGTLIRVPNAFSWHRRANKLFLSARKWHHEIHESWMLSRAPSNFTNLHHVFYFNFACNCTLRTLCVAVPRGWRQRCGMGLRDYKGRSAERDGNPLSRRANWHLCKILHRHSSHSTNALNRLQIVTNAYLIDGWHSLLSGGRNELNWINVF